MSRSFAYKVDGSDEELVVAKVTSHTAVGVDGLAVPLGERQAEAAAAVERGLLGGRHDGNGLDL